MEVGWATGCVKAVGAEAGWCTTGGGNSWLLHSWWLQRLLMQLWWASLWYWWLKQAWWWDEEKVGKLAVAYLVCLWSSAGEASCKLEVGTPT